MHVSQLADRFVSKPADVVQLQQHVKVKVMNIDIERKRISLSMKDLNHCVHISLSYHAQSR